MFKKKIKQSWTRHENQFAIQAVHYEAHEVQKLIAENKSKYEIVNH